MKHLVALLAMFLAMPMFADGNGDSGDDLTNKKIQDNILNSITSLSRRLDSKVNSLQTALGTAQSSITTLQTALATAQSAITTLQGAATRNEVAIVMTVPDDRRCMAGSGQRRCYGKTFLMGSTIPDFPRGTVSRTTFEFTDSSLPAGTYLVELQQPYSDNPLCDGSATAYIQVNPEATRRFSKCPRFRIFGNTWRLDNGSRIYTVASGARSTYLSPEHRFPNGWAFTTAAPLISYTGTIKITRLKP